MSGEHCPTPPSSAARRVQCRASAQLEQLYPELEETEDAKEGTASHEIAASMLRLVNRKTRFPEFNEAQLLTTPEQYVDHPATNGVIHTLESYEAARLYADTVATLIKPGGYEARVEQRVSIERIHPELWGTPDCSLYDPDAKHLHVFDYKYGYRLVEVFENWQLIEYAIGLIDEYGLDGIDDQELKITLWIVQPRAYHPRGPVRKTTLRGSDLRGYANIASQVEHECRRAGAMMRTGPECKYCTARHVCGALQAEGYESMAYVSEMSVVELDPASLALEMVRLEWMINNGRSRLTGLQAQAEQLIRSGTVVPGFDMEAGRGSTDWTVPAEEVFTLGDMFGVDLRKPAAPKTPNQAKQVFKLASLDESTIDAMSRRVSGALQLKQTGTEMARIFTNRSE